MHYQVQTPTSKYLDNLELGPSPQDLKWLFGIRFTPTKCNGFSYLTAPDTLPNTHAIDAVYDEKSFQHLHLAFLYYVAAATGSWGYFLNSQQGLKLRGSGSNKSKGADDYTKALLYFDYLGRIGENGNRCEAWERLKVPHIINDNICHDFPIGTKQQPVDDVSIYRGPNPLVPGNPLEYWDPKGDEPRPRTPMYAFPRPGEQRI